MVSKLYFEETFSLVTAQELQGWANANLLVQSDGDYGMKVEYVSAGEMVSETTLSGLTIDNEYTVTTDTKEVVSNVFRTKINSLPNDNTSTVAELGYGLGVRSFTFTATAETMYLAICDMNAGVGVYFLLDNISVKGDGVDYVVNGTFEDGNTNGWTQYNSSVTAYQYNISPPIGDDNIYLEQVNIPVYDAGNTTHCLIPDDGEWIADTLNTASWQHFYVRPGTYLGRPNVIVSGSGVQRRTVSPYLNPDIHPSLVNDSERAKISIEFNNASYWTLHNMSSNLERYTDSSGTINRGNLFFNRGSSFNIVNQFYAGQGWQQIGIKRNANNNTIQKCYFDSVDEGAWAVDLSMIQLEDGVRRDSNGDPIEITNILNTKIILNECRNYKLVRLQLFVSSDSGDDETGWKNYAGTTVDSNVVWFDEDVYCDLDGTPNPSGDFARCESGFSGVKCGSDDSSNPVIYSNNALIGARQSYDDNPDILRSPSPSFAIVYYYSKNVNILNNAVVDCPAGFSFTSGDGSAQTWDCLGEGNIIYKCGFNNYTGTEHDERCTSMRFQATTDCINRLNIIKDPIDEWANCTGNKSGGYFGQNVVINMDEPMISSTQGITGGLDPDTTDYFTTAEGDIEYPHDYTIYYKKYTDSPLTEVIPNVLKVPQA